MDPRCFLFLILLSALCVAQCNGSAGMSVPAVVGSGSDTVNISVTIVPGSGGAYLSVYPQTSTTTQQSVHDAVEYGLGKANESGCDAIVSISSGSASYVDGPSAGAAIAVLTYGAATGMSPRQDAMMTGAVDPEGGVGQVGGLYEKSLAVAASGAKYFMTPNDSIFDTLMLRNSEAATGLRVVEAGNMDDAIGFMLFNQSLPAPSLERESEPVPDVPQYDPSAAAGFYNVAAGMMSLENRTVQGLPSSDNDSATIKKYYSSELSRQEKILGKGYLFSAANEAFEDYIEASTVGAMLTQDTDLQTEKESVARCIASLPDIPKTSENFQWLVGADARRSWAENQLNSTDISGADTVDEKYSDYDAIMYAYAWCSVSGLLSDAAGRNGTELNESAWKGLASAELAQAEGLDNLDADLAQHLDSARLSFDQGRYGAALFDCTYVIETSQADSDMVGMGSADMKSQVQAMLAEKRISLWGAVYQSHAAWLAAQNNTSLEPEAFTTLRYAEGLDALFARMESLARPAAQPQTQPSSGLQTILVVLLMFLILIVLIYILVRKAYDQGLSDGAKRGIKRPRHVPRTGQKQG